MGLTLQAEALRPRHLAGVAVRCAESSVSVCLALDGKHFEMARWVRICVRVAALLRAESVSSCEGQTDKC